MKRSNISSAAFITSLCLCVSPIGWLSAQSADVFQALQGSSQVTGSGNTTKSPPDIEVLKSKPSRYAVGYPDLYSTARAAEFSMNNRARDPFGLHQDPDFKPAVRKGPTLKPRETYTNQPPVALTEIVSLFKVSTIMLKEKSFLLKEGRILKEEEEIEISYQGRTRRLQVIKVESNQIRFKDLESNEEAILKIELLPFGMSSGDSKIRPAGMVSPKDNEPLKLELK